MASFIWLMIAGIVFACKTKDQAPRFKSVILHFLIFGGVIAAIIYSVATNVRKNKNELMKKINQEKKTK